MGREWTPAHAGPRLRAVELWIPAAITLFIGLRWLLAERHSVFGDEFFHLTNCSPASPARHRGPALMDSSTSTSSTSPIRRCFT